MTKNAVEQVWNSYLEAYGNVSTEDRKRLLKESVSDDVISENPGKETHGIEALIVHVEQFQQRLPGSCFKLNSLKFHHEQVLAEWTLYKADGTAVTTAHTYGVLDDQGRLTETDRLLLKQLPTIRVRQKLFSNKEYRILSRSGLTVRKRSEDATTPCSEPFSLVTSPNQLWCMDFKG